MFRVSRNNAPQQPFVVVACCFLLGAWLGSLVGVSFWVALGAALLLTLLFLIFREGVSLCLAVVAVGALVTTAGRGASIVGMGAVESVVRIERTNQLVVEAYRDPMDGRWRGCSDKIYFGSDSLFRPNVGEQYVLRLSIEEGEWGDYISRQDVLMQLSSDGQYAGYRRINDWLFERLKRLELSDDTQAMCAAMSLGRREELSKQVRANYIQSGLSHLLALSGLHIGVLIVIFGLLLRPLYVLPNGLVWSRSILVMLILFYAVVVGLSASVQRAVLMALLLGVSIIATRRYRVVNVLLFSAVILLCFDVSLLYNVGFQLSFVSVLAIALWAVPLSNAFVGWCTRFGWSRWVIRCVGFVVGALLVGVACVVATWPIVANTFGIVSFWGAFASPFVTITTFMILLLSILWMLLSIPVLAPLFAWALEGIVWVQNTIAELLSATVEIQMEWWLVTLIYLFYGVLTLWVRATVR